MNEQELFNAKYNTSMQLFRQENYLRKYIHDNVEIINAKLQLIDTLHFPEKYLDANLEGNRKWLKQFSLNMLIEFSKHLTIDQLNLRYNVSELAKYDCEKLYEGYMYFERKAQIEQWKKQAEDL